MRTNEERAGLIHMRTAKIKRERQKRKQRALDMICMAACLILVVGIGSFMPGLTAGIPGGFLETFHGGGANAGMDGIIILSHIVFKHSVKFVKGIYFPGVDGVDPRSFHA